MDLMVTTDNGVMNLAGALGKKTFGIFNTISEWRWFKTDGEDIVWYKSIKPFTCPTSDAWEVPVKAILDEINKMRTKNVAQKIKSDMIFAPQTQGYRPTPRVIQETVKEPEPVEKKKTTKSKSETTKTKAAPKSKTNML
jgi:hypothetical protein